MYYHNGDVSYQNTEYTLHGKNIVHLTQGGNNLHFFYDAGGKPAVVDFNGVKYGYIVNLQGDVLGLVDGNGNEVVKYTYDAWGKVLSTTGSLAATLGAVQPFRYRGYVYDVETGLYYLRSRYYHPTWNRFLNSDGKTKGNLFKYCANMPTVCLDYTGNDFIIITDTNGLSHTSALVQDGDGDWYYYYWGASKEGSSSSFGDAGNMVYNTSISSVPFARGNVCVIYERINLHFSPDGEFDLAAFNKTLNSNIDTYRYAGDYERFTHVKGDFSEAHRLAEYNQNNADKLTYNLITMNCAHSVYTLFVEAYKDEKKEKDTYFNNAQKLLGSFLRTIIFVPILMHDYFDRK